MNVFTLKQTNFNLISIYFCFYLFYLLKVKILFESIDTHSHLLTIYFLSLHKVNFAIYRLMMIDNNTNARFSFETEF